MKLFILLYSLLNAFKIATGGTLYGAFFLTDFYQECESAGGNDLVLSSMLLFLYYKDQLFPAGFK